MFYGAPLARFFVVCVAGTILASFSAYGQWDTQEIDLHEGWNSVFLLVDPEPADCDTLFASTPFTPVSVRAYKDRFSTIQFVSDEAQVIDTAPEWLTWVPAADETHFARSLFALRGGRAYFIELPAGAPPVTWNLVGRVLPQTTDWKGGAFNLVGFELNDNASPTFEEFFSPSSVHTGAIFRMNSAGIWTQVADPATETMSGGEAFWMLMGAPSTYQGPIRIEPDSGGTLDFGRTLSEMSVTLHNDSSVTRTVRVSRVDSDTQPASVTNTVHAGQMPLDYWHADLSTSTFGWTPFGQLDIPLGPGAFHEIRVAPLRKAILSPPLNSTYQSLLRIEDLGGPSRYTLPVIARGLEVLDAEGQPQHAFSGMWSGYVSVQKVSEPATQPNTPTPTASEFSFRVLIHVDAAGQARLLPWVIQMFKEGTLEPVPGDPGFFQVDEPGREVWMTDLGYANQFVGVTLRDGEQVGRRISSAVFSFDQPLPLDGAGNFGSNIITNEVTVDFDDRLNPFKHKYHPDHDNIDGLSGTIEEAFTFTRGFEFEFTVNDPEGLALPGWCETQLGGIYRETISGIHKDPIHVEGIFRINLLSRVNVLNDGLGL